MMTFALVPDWGTSIVTVGPSRPVRRTSDADAANARRNPTITPQRFEGELRISLIVRR